MVDGNFSYRDDTYQTERLDNLYDRVSRMEGRMEHLATREDVSNVRYSLLLAIMSILLSLFAAAISVFVHLLSTRA